MLQSVLLLAAMWLLAITAGVNVRAERTIARQMTVLQAEMALRARLEEEVGRLSARAREFLLAAELPARADLERTVEAARAVCENGQRAAHPMAHGPCDGLQSLAAVVAALAVRPGEEQARDAMLAGLLEREAELRRQMSDWGRAQANRVAAAQEEISGRAANLYLSLGGFLLLAVGGISLFRRAQERQLWAPLEAMRRMVLELKRGNLRARAPQADSVELRPLAEALGAMAVEVAETRHRLEQKVQERTARLEQAQEQLLRAARLSALGELVAGVAHEVNNPLTSILGFSEVLLARRGLDPALRPAVETIRAEALRLRHTVANLTGFAERSRPRMASFDLRVVLDRLAVLRGYQLRAARIRLSVSVPAEPLWVHGDADLLLQALFSVVLNAEQAILAVRDSGTIRIEAAREGDRVTFAVSDDGCGMEAATQSRIFEPFFTTRAQGGGTGMGLTVARTIVEQHGGRLEVESAAGQGSRFMFTLPYAEPPASAGAPQGKTSSERRHDVRRRALVVDDEKGILELAAQALAARGWQCITLEETSRLPETLAGEEFDLVLCDMRMPGMNGLDVLRLLRREWPQLAARFILMTGDPSEMAADAAEFAGVALLRKPFTLAQLYAAVEAAMAR